MASFVGNLVVRLNAQSRDYERKFNRATSLTSKFRRAAGALGPILGGLSSAFTLAGLTIYTKRSLSAIDATAKLADRIGASTEFTAAMGFAAEQTGTSIANMNSSLERFSRRVGQASDGAGQGRKALDKLGLDAAKLVNLPLDQSFTAVAQAISELPTQAEKAAVAADLFGRSGLELLNLLDGGEATVRGFVDEARQLGLVFSRSEAAKVEAANDAINRIKRSMGGLTNTLAIHLAPAIESFAGRLQEIIRTSQDLAANVVGFARIVVGSITSMASAVANSPFGQLAGQFARLVAVGGGVLLIFNSIAALLPVIGTGLVAAFAALTGPIGVTVTLLGALGAAIVQATAEGETFAQRLDNFFGGVIPSAIDNLVFAFRNFADLAQIAIVDIVDSALDLFPQMEKPIERAAAFFIGAWSGAGAFFGSFIDNLMAGFQELKNFAVAIFDGIAAAFQAMVSGDFRGALASFTREFQSTLARQANVEAPNAFEEFGKAFASAQDDALRAFEREGGFSGALAARRQELLDSISARELERSEEIAQRARKAQEAVENTERAMNVDAVSETSTQLSGAALRGSAEAASIIARAMTGRRGPQEEVARNTKDLVALQREELRRTRQAPRVVSI